MKLHMLFKDHEYMAALIDGIGRTDNSIVIEIIDSYSSFRKLSDAFILTDVNNEKQLLTAINESGNCFVLFSKGETVSFNSKSNESIFVKRIFMYQNINSIIAQIKSAYNELVCVSNEESVSVAEETYISGINLLGVLCDGNNNRAISVSDRMARQIIYRTGDKVSRITLCGINSDELYVSCKDSNCKVSVNDTKAELCIHKLVYLIEGSKNVPREEMLYEDAFGIGKIRMQSGLNTINELNLGVIRAIINQIKSYGYRHVILVFGDHISSKNVELIASCNSVLWIDEIGSEDLYAKVKNDIGSKVSTMDWQRLNVNSIEKPIDIWIDEYVSSICEK